MGKRRKYTYDWPRPMVTVDAAVFTFIRGRAHLLLIKRANEPFKNKWALPGGFVGIDEELADAAARELEEETGLTGAALQQMYTFGNVGRDPRGRQITIVYMSVIIRWHNKIKAGDDAAKARWFDVEKLPADLAFDHDEVARFAIKKLKRKRIYRKCRKNYI